MSFKDAIVNDMNMFFNPLEFGESAILSRTNSTITVILDKDMDTETGRIYDIVIAKTSDISGIQVGDTFTIGSNILRNVSHEISIMDELMCFVRVENDGI